eukprot:GHVT01012686.1.p1 GENE.GHVT01012686.1~~GHVT01012686.1.p1  ORF type:complete len:231 (+),score=9.85 GHVT01012686.1:542-1234(+)
MPAPPLRGAWPLQAMLACGFAAFLALVGRHGAACAFSTSPASMKSFFSTSASRRLAPNGKPGVDSKSVKPFQHLGRRDSYGANHTGYYLELLANSINQNRIKRYKTLGEKLLTVTTWDFEDDVSISMGAGEGVRMSDESAFRLLESGIFDDDSNPGNYLATAAHALDVHFNGNWEIQRTAYGQSRFFVGQRPHLLPLPVAALKALTTPDWRKAWTDWRLTVKKLASQGGS